MTTLQITYTCVYAIVFIAAMAACIVCAVRDARAAAEIRRRMSRMRRL